LIFLWLLRQVDEEQFEAELLDPPVPPGRCAALVGPMASLTGTAPSGARTAAPTSAFAVGVGAAANAKLAVIIAAAVRKTVRVMASSVLSGTNRIEINRPRCLLDRALRRRGQRAKLSGQPKIGCGKRPYAGFMRLPAVPSRIHTRLSAHFAAQ
jgi:hypothetical protein